jgi:anti-sigma factor RsiW
MSGRADYAMRFGMVQRLRDRLECRRVRPLLQTFLDGELDPSQRQRVVRHLDACRRCGLEAATYATLIDRLHGVARPAHPDAVARLEAFVEGLAATNRGDDPSAI